MNQLKLTDSAYGAKKKELMFLIENLSHEERLVISLYYHEELSFKEIALVLRKSEAQIWTLYADAIGVMLRLKFS